MKHKSRLCDHRRMQKGGGNYWETYASVVNWISIWSLLSIVIIHELPSRSIDFVLAFTLDELDVDMLMELPLGILVVVNRE